uniref:Uncharacterized protein n=1 Tax=Anopheles dirus TaxID=7168 RepID=A0A182NYL4_9DIPT
MGAHQLIGVLVSSAAVPA